MADPRPQMDPAPLPPPPPPPPGASRRAFVAPADPNLATPTWGLGDALAGWLIGFVAANLVYGLILGISGYARHPEDAPLALQALSYPPLWLGFAGVPLWAAAKKGNGWIRDFRVSIRWSDVPLGLVIGFAAQLVLVPLLSWPVMQLTGTDSEDLSRPAQELADTAVGTWGPLLFVLIVGIGAPIVEELFFRGLVLRSFEKRWGPWVALVATSVWFGATHFQVLQLAALVGVGLVLGLLVLRTGRLGLAIMAHMGFNLTTVAVLLWVK